MGQPGQSEEQSILSQVHKIIDDLIAFDDDSRVRIYRTVGTFFRFDGVDPRREPETETPGTPPGRSREPHFSTAPEPKDFLFEKQPTSTVERVACLAYYLKYYREHAHFKTTDISKLNSEAAQVKLSNSSAALNDAVRYGLLTAVADGKKQLTVLGEKYVEALPDHATARKFRSRMRPRRPRKKPVANDDAARAGQ